MLGGLRLVLCKDEEKVHAVGCSTVLTRRAFVFVVWNLLIEEGASARVNIVLQLICIYRCVLLQIYQENCFDFCGIWGLLKPFGVCSSLRLFCSSWKLFQLFLKNDLFEFLI